MKRKMEKMSEVSRVKTYKKGSKWGLIINGYSRCWCLSIISW